MTAGDATGSGEGALARFAAPVAEWFRASFPAPTPAQAQAWPAIAAGEHALVLAPTGSGKTLAAFLWAIDRLLQAPTTGEGTRLVYVSPLRALAVDVEKNLRAPLAGIAHAAERLSRPVTVPTVGMRTGDTSPADRRRLARTPADILITTPESLYLLLTSAARETLRNVDAVIVDEIHALAPTKRGAHLMVTLERLAELTGGNGPQRIGLSATQRPLDELARFLGGHGADGAPRPVRIVDAGIRKPLDLEVVVPVDDLGRMGDLLDDAPAATPGGPVRRSIWPALHPQVLDLVRSHRSTIVFVNSRRLAERLATRLNELAAGASSDTDLVGRPPSVDLVKAHHGSISREQRLVIEDQLKRGELRGIVATSSLELGIDMGAVDLVVQVESPGRVSRGLQRIGRAGHQVGEPSRGRIFPKHRGDLLEAAVVAQRMRAGEVEAMRYPRNPLDVAAQQIVAMTAMEEWTVRDLRAVLRRAAPFAGLSDDVFAAVLDLLAGRYPSDEFAELRPRVVWDRGADVVRARTGAHRIAVTNPGTIPDRGLFGVFLPDGRRVGELDEEMVYEARPGETFLLGASTWRIEEITHDRVVVTPAPGESGRMPFWRGDHPGRPLELGRALGAFVREVRARTAGTPSSAEGAAPDPSVVAWLRDEHSLDARAARNVVRYLDEQAAASAVPDDHTIVVERFRDEIGDWRVCVLSPFGAQVHAPWAIALRARLRERWDTDVDLLWSDDGIVVRLPEAIEELPLDDLLFDPDEITELLVAELPSTAMFATHFRECAGRALLLPRRRPDRRTALWQQRQRAADLLRVAAGHPSFPILLETVREVMEDVFDVPALCEVQRDIRARRTRVVPVTVDRASPFAQSLLYGWIAVFMYEGDAPVAERRAAALSLDRDLLRELLGADELRDLLDAAVIDELEAELQRLVEARRARDADDVWELLRDLGPLTRDEVVARATSGDWHGRALGQLQEDRRLIEVTIAGERRLAAAEDAAVLRDALGVALPAGLPAVFTDPVEAPLVDLLARHARTHGPFVLRAVTDRFGVSADRVLVALGALEDAGRLVVGEFRPGGVQREWCDAEVLRTLRRRSLAALRREIEPAEAAAFGRFLPAWQGVGARRSGPDALTETVAQLQGAALAASILETDVLPARVRDFRPADLDALCTSGDVVWVGAAAVGVGPLGAADGRLRLFFRDELRLLCPPPDPDAVPDDPVAVALRAQLTEGGASFWPQLVSAVAAADLPYDDDAVLRALWSLVWAGEVTNDSYQPVRAFLAGATGRTRATSGSARHRGRPRPGRLAASGPAAGAGRWSLVAPLREPAPAPTDVALARAQQLLERHGICTREGVVAEGVAGGFAGVYPVLGALEEQGRVRRGYFVTGLGGAQFALAGAVDRLRAPATADTSVLVLAAADPAQPYGAALAWPERSHDPTSARPSRAAGAFVVMVDGAPVAFVERGGRSLLTFAAIDEAAGWADAVASLVKDGHLRRLELTRIDGAPAASSPHAAALREAGFADGYRGLVLRG